MKKILSKLKHNTLFGIIIGGIVFGSLGIYGANVYESNSIEYSPTDTSWEVSNVNEAINSLYSIKNELDNIKTIGDATAAQILSGKKAVVKGSSVTGTMTNRGAWTSTPTSSGKVTIPAGYHNGSGYVDTTSVYNKGYNDGNKNTPVLLGTFSFSRDNYTANKSTTLTMNISSSLTANGLNASNLTISDFRIEYVSFAFQASHSSSNKIGGISDVTRVLQPSASYSSGIISLANGIQCYSADGGYYYIYPKTVSVYYLK